jgi:hypothetical protein
LEEDSMTLEEFDKMCEAPEVDELDHRQAELWERIEFVAIMREACGNRIQEA